MADVMWHSTSVNDAYDGLYNAVSLRECMNECHGCHGNQTLIDAHPLPPPLSPFPPLHITFSPFP